MVRPLTWLRRDHPPDGDEAVADGAFAGWWRRRFAAFAAYLADFRVAVAARGVSHLLRAFGGDEVCLCVEGVVHVSGRSLAYVREVVVPFDVCEVPVRVTDGVLANVGEVVVLFEQGLADVHGACVVDSQCRPYDCRLFHCDEL